MVKGMKGIKIKDPKVLYKDPLPYYTIGEAIHDTNMLIESLISDMSIDMSKDLTSYVLYEAYGDNDVKMSDGEKDDKSSRFGHLSDKMGSRFDATLDRISSRMSMVFNVIMARVNKVYNKIINFFTGLFKEKVNPFFKRVKKFWFSKYADQEVTGKIYNKKLLDDPIGYIKQSPAYRLVDLLKTNNVELLLKIDMDELVALQTEFDKGLVEQEEATYKLGKYSFEAVKKFCDSSLMINLEIKTTRDSMKSWANYYKDDSTAKKTLKDLRFKLFKSQDEKEVIQKSKDIMKLYKLAIRLINSSTSNYLTAYKEACEQFLRHYKSVIKDLEYKEDKQKEKEKKEWEKTHVSYTKNGEKITKLT